MDPITAFALAEVLGLGGTVTFVAVLLVLMSGADRRDRERLARRPEPEAPRLLGDTPTSRHARVHIVDLGSRRGHRQTLAAEWRQAGVAIVTARPPLERGRVGSGPWSTCGICRDGHTPIPGCPICATTVEVAQ